MRAGRKAWSVSARAISDPWGTWLRPRGGLFLRTGAVALALLCALPSPPTLAATGSAPTGRLALSEWAPIAPPGVGEAAGEWVELVVEEPGTLAGWGITDNDGTHDFTFPDVWAERGDRLLVANGRAAPAGAPDSARVLFMNKSGWTWENTGDDVVLVEPSGVPAGRWTFGGGDAIDPAPAGLDGADRAFEVPPAGSTLAVAGAAGGVARPTPGEENALVSRGTPDGLVVAGTLWAGAPRALAVCNERSSPFVPFGWSLHDGDVSVNFDGRPLEPGACVGWVSDLPLAVRSQGEASMGRTGIRWQEADDVPNATAPGGLRTSDLWGAHGLLLDRGPPVGLGARPARWWVPCACNGGWRPAPLEPFAAVGSPRQVDEVSVVPAGPRLRESLAALAHDAKVSLWVNAYALSYAPAADAMVAAAARGVSVRLLVEPRPVGWGEQEGAIPPAIRGALEEAGVEVRPFLPGGLLPARDHAKYAVADGARVAVLTENLVESALGDGPTNTGYGVFATSKGLAADLAQVFEWDWALAGGSLPPPPGGPQAAAPPPEGPSTAQLLVSPGEGSLSAWTSLVDGASTRIQVEALSGDADILGPAGPLGQALLRAAARGVQVEVLVAPDLDAPAGGSAGRSLGAAADALGHRLEVREDARLPSGPTKLHAKAMVVDGQALVIGSHNLVSAAFSSNREVSLSIRDPAAAANLSASLAQDFARAEPVGARPVVLASGDSLGDIPQTGNEPPAVSVLSLLLVAGAGLALAGAVIPPRAARRGRRHRRPPRDRAARENASPDGPSQPGPAAPPPGFALRVAPARATALPASAGPGAPEVLLPPSAAERFEQG